MLDRQVNLSEMINTYMENQSENRTLDVAGIELGYDQIINHKLGSLILGISPRTLQNYGYERKLPIYRMGNRNLFLVEDLIAYSEERRVEADGSN